MVWGACKKATSPTTYVLVNSKEFEQVDSVKVLGVTISNTLQWNCHVSEIIKKANKQMYFLILLKRAKVPASDIVSFYTTCIRPVLEYCAPLYHIALPDYLCKDKERVQKRVLSIISPALSNQDSLQSFKINTLKVRRSNRCQNMASRYCQKSSSFLNLSKIPNYISRYSYKWSSFHTGYSVSHFFYRDAHTICPVFNTRDSVSHFSYRDLDENSTKTRRDEEISTKTRRDFKHQREPISVLFFSWERTGYDFDNTCDTQRPLYQIFPAVLCAACKNESGYPQTFGQY